MVVFILNPCQILKDPFSYDLFYDYYHHCSPPLRQRGVPALRYGRRQALNPQRLAFPAGSPAALRGSFNPGAPWLSRPLPLRPPHTGPSHTSSSYRTSNSKTLLLSYTHPLGLDMVPPEEPFGSNSINWSPPHDTADQARSHHRAIPSAPAEAFNASTTTGAQPSRA